MYLENPKHLIIMNGWNKISKNSINHLATMIEAPKFKELCSMSLSSLPACRTSERQNKISQECEYTRTHCDIMHTYKHKIS